LKKNTRNGIIASALTALLVLAPLTASAAFASDASDAANIFALTNSARQANDLPAVARNSSLDSVAQAWAQNLADNGYNDSNPHNPNVGSQIPAGWISWGENVAYVQEDTSSQMFTNWMNSPSHYATLMGSTFTDVGIGYVTDALGFSYGVQVFANYPPTAPSTPTAPTVSSLGVDNIHAEWTAPYDGRSGLTGYNVRLHDASNSVVQNVFVAFPATTVDFSGLVNGANYTVSLAAVNSIGTSAFSAPSSPVKAPAIPADAPATPELTAVPGALSASWLAPTYDGGAAITSYTVTLTKTSDLTTITVAVDGALNEYIFTGLRGASAYTVQVEANNEAGASLPSPASSSANAPFTAPDPVASVSAVATATHQITASWEAPLWNGGTPVTGYTVSLNGATPINVGAGVNELVFNGLTPGALYEVAVVAYNSVASAEQSSTLFTLPAVVSSAPLNVSAVLSDERQGTVTWSAPSYDGGAAILEYHVSATNLAGGSDFSMVVPADTFITSFSGLDIGSNYEFTVVAVNVAGASASAYSNVITVPLAPGTPDAVSVIEVLSSTTDSLHITWAAPYNGGAAILSYDVDVYDQDGFLVNSMTVGATTTEANFMGLTPNTDYTFIISAANYVGATPTMPNNVHINALAPSDIATGNVVITSNQSLQLTWDAPLFDGGIPLTDYKVEVYVNGLFSHNIYTSNTMLLLSGLNAGTNYDFIIFANNADTASVNGFLASGTTFDVPASPESVEGSYDILHNSVSFTWAPPAYDSGAAVTSYNVKVYEDGSVTPWANETVNSDVFIMTFSGFTTGRSYYAEISAINLYGASPAGVSTLVAIPAVTPDAPTAVEVSISNGDTANIFWVPAADNGATETLSYTVVLYSSSFAGGELTTTVPATGTTATITGLAPGAHFYARVFATNADGNSPLSDPSATLTVPIVEPSAPAAPSITLNGTDGIDVQWTAPVSNGGAAIQAYRVTLKSTTAADVVAVVGSSTLDYTFLGLTPGAFYTASVQASNISGYSFASLASNVVRIAPVLSSPPVNPNAAITADTTVTFTWDAPVNNGGSEIEGYEVVIQSGGDYLPITVVGNSYTLTGANELAAYSFNVRALNEVGYSEFSEISAFITVPPVTPPTPMEDTEFVESNAGNVSAELLGTMLTAQIPDMSEGEWVYGYAYSTPTPLGWTQVTAAHTASWSIASAGLAAGNHTLAVMTDSALVGWTGFVVPATSTGGTGGTGNTGGTTTTGTTSVKAGTASDTNLAGTGTDSALPVGIAILLLLAGAGAILLNRKVAVKEVRNTRVGLAFRN
jgi:uncharacterized protein YkwD